MTERKESIPEFINKVLDMMQQFPALINWGSQGQELVILNQQQFEKLVLKKYFRHGKLESFVRQLNMYNFHKVCRNKNSINFRNKYFFEGNEANFHLIKRRKKDSEQENDGNDKTESDFLSLIAERHDKIFPQLSTMVSQILQFKSKSNKTMTKLRKTLDSLGRQINERKGKTVKPIITEVKEMITSIEDSSKKTDIIIEQKSTTLEKDATTDVGVKEQNMSAENQDQQISEEKIQNNKNIGNGFNAHHQPVIPQAINAISYPALHNSNNFFNQGMFTHTNAILAVSSLCSFNSVNSVTNFIA